MDRSDQLRQLMAERNLQPLEVAQLTGASYETVRGWLTRADSTRHREPSAQTLELLEIKTRNKRRR